MAFLFPFPFSSLKSARYLSGQKSITDGCPGGKHHLPFEQTSAVKEIISVFSSTSPRRTSKTPDGSEKMKRNVRFQDEFTAPVSSSSADERSSIEKTERQDQRREIMHSDGKVSNFGPIKAILFSFLVKRIPGEARL